MSDIVPPNQPPSSSSGENSSYNKSEKNSLPQPRGEGEVPLHHKKAPGRVHFHSIDTKPPEPRCVPQSDSDRILAIVCHLALFFGFPFLAPFVIFLITKNEMPFAESHARGTLNAHLSYLFYSLLCLPLIPVFGIGFILLIVLGALLFVFTISAAFRAANRLPSHYPLAFPIL